MGAREWRVEVFGGVVGITSTDGVVTTTAPLLGKFVGCRLSALVDWCRQKDRRFVITELFWTKKWLRSRHVRWRS